MKENRISKIISIICALALIVSTGVAIFTAQGNSSAMIDIAAKRDGKPDPNAVYIEPDLTALAAQCVGNAETQAASKQAFDLINAKRAEAGLKPYVWNNGLEQAAEVRAYEASQRWAHTRPDGSDYWTVNEAIVYGENLAKGYANATDVVKAWIDSPTHLANILDGELQSAGISIHLDNLKWFWANEFGY